MRSLKFPYALFEKPEIRLAWRISSTVLLLLLSVVALAGMLTESAHDTRRSEFFRSRESGLSRRPMMMENLEKLPMEELGHRMGERRVLPANLRNMAVVFPSGEIETLWILEGEEVSGAFKDLPQRSMQIRRIGGEKYVLYAFPAGDRTVVFYEPEEVLEGAKNELLLSFALSIVLFSMLLFFVSLKIAKRVIEPIERLAERERAYAKHIAHELKTPLAVAKSDLELALELPKEKNERIRSAVNEISSMRSTVDDLLLLSLSEGGISKERVNLRKLVTEEIEKDSNSPVRWNLLPKGTESEEVEADPRLLRTLIRNLAANVRIHAKPKTDAEIIVNAHGISFRNQSSEIPKKLGKSEFDAFEWTPGKGSGIGLSLVQRICELHGWNISFKFENGEVIVWVRF